MYRVVYGDGPALGMVGFRFRLEYPFDPSGVKLMKWYVTMPTGVTHLAVRADSIHDAAIRIAKWWNQFYSNLYGPEPKPWVAPPDLVDWLDSPGSDATRKKVAGGCLYDWDEVRIRPTYVPVALSASITVIGGDDG